MISRVEYFCIAPPKKLEIIPMKRIPSLVMVFLLAAVAAVEIDCVERFSSAAKLCAYAGLVPRTHASGGRVYQGPLVKSRNKWLQWAFIEAAWVAIGCSAYFGGLYRQHRARGKNANIAITSIARRSAKSALHCSKKGEILLKLSPVAPQLD